MKHKLYIYIKHKLKNCNSQFTELKRESLNWIHIYEYIRRVMYNVTLRRVWVTTVTVEKQYVLHTMSVCP